MFLSIYIRNRFHRAVQLFEDGDARGVLLPNMRHRFDTHVGKLWSGYTPEETLIFREKMDYFWMDRNDTSYDTPFSDCTLPNDVRKSLPPNTDGTFFISKYPRAHLYFWNGTCEQYVDTLYSHKKQHILAIQGHAFRLRDESNATILSQRVLKDFVIDGQWEDHFMRLQTEEWEFERESLRQKLMAEMSRLTTHLTLSRLPPNESIKNVSDVTKHQGLLSIKEIAGNTVIKEVHEEIPGTMTTSSCLPSHHLTKRFARMY
jgi:hypothetical protein